MKYLFSLSIRNMFCSIVSLEFYILHSALISLFMNIQVSICGEKKLFYRKAPFVIFHLIFI